MRRLEISTTSTDETIRLAETIGSELRGGEVLELVSDLGGGKTTFVRGLAKGMGSDDVVRSPSFTIGNEYRSGSKELTLYHFDFYRLQEPGVMRDELAEAMSDPKSIITIEWGGIINDVLPADRLTVDIKATGQDSRSLVLSYPEELEYLVANT